MKMTMNDILALLREVCGEENIFPQTELLKSGLLDSYALINLLSELDARNISIEPTRVDIERFATAEDIFDLCRSYS